MNRLVLRSLLLIGAIFAFATASRAEIPSGITSLDSLSQWLYDQNQEWPDNATMASLLKDELASDPDGEQAGRLSTLLARLLWKDGNPRAALPYLEKGRQRGVADAFEASAMGALLDFDIPQARTFMAKADDLRKKVGEETGESPLNDIIDQTAERLRFVEQIVVIDSLCVPKDSLLSAFRLPAGQGRLVDAAFLETVVPEGHGRLGTGFMNALGDRIVFSAQNVSDSYDNLAYLYETMLLADGEWSAPEILEIPMEEASYLDSAYPFFTIDGATVFFSAVNADTHDLDILKSTRNADGSYQTAVNVGLPFNSVANDYLFVEDEENGVGWFATDRNSPEGMVNVYVFKLNEYRVNYDPETTDVAAKAALADWMSTWPEGEDFSELAEAIQAIDPSGKEETLAFTFQVTPQRVYHNYEDFNSPDAEELMRRYVADADELAEFERELRQLRDDYHTLPSKSLGNEILRVEKERDAKRKALRKLRAKILTIEIPTLR